MKTLKEGTKIPNLKELIGDNTEKYKGKKVILYFYPKDNTPGCIAEACNLRDNYEKLKQEGFEVIGVSPDSEKSHEKFAAKHELPFDLIADTDKKLMNAFGVWGEKKMYGRTYDGVHRTTFVLSETGEVEHVIKKVKTKDHATQIFEAYENK